MSDPSRFIAEWRQAPWAGQFDTAWALAGNAEKAITDRLGALTAEYRISNGVAIHHHSTIESGAVLKGPVIVGPDCLVAAGAYLRGGVWLQARCIIGPACELKSSFLFADSKIAHLSFVGDSVLGSGVNVEAGAMIANYRNELSDKRIRIQTASGIVDTGADKFGALVGDGVRIGANAVIAPGAILARSSVVKRLELIDQRPETHEQASPGPA